MKNSITRFLHTTIYILLFLFTGFPLYANMRFISSKDGLSNTSVLSIFQDSHNYVWITTDYGLNRLSGADIKVFQQSFQNEGALPNNYTFSVMEDSDGDFWVGTLNGVFNYDPITETFIPFIPETYPFVENAKIATIIEDYNRNIWFTVSGHGLLCYDKVNGQSYLFDYPELKELDINTMLLVDNRELWLATLYGGISIFNLETKQTHSINHITPENAVLKEYSLFSLCEDRKGNIWVSSLGGGVYSIGKNSKKLTVMVDGKEFPELKLAHSLLCDRNGRIWIGTDGGGLWIMDEKQGGLRSYPIQNFGFDPGIGKVLSLYEDNQGSIWVAFTEKGVVVIPSDEYGFKIIQDNPYSKFNISDQSVLSLLVDKDEFLWLGTGGGGLYRLKPLADHSGFELYDRILEHENVITCLYQDRKGLIYIGTYLHGFYMYDPHTEKTVRFSREVPYSVNSNHITDVVEDSYGYIWISTNGGGVNRMDPVTGEFIYFRQADGGIEGFLISDWCNSLYLDNNSQLLWIGSYGGVSSIDIETHEIHSFIKEDGSIHNNSVVTISGDEQQNVWIGSIWGLTCLDYRTRKSYLYTTEDGLPDNRINGLQKDKNGNLWVITNSGVARYDLINNKFVGYTQYDGINNTEFKANTTTIDSEGNLFLGGINGITWFHPEKLDEPKQLSRVVLTEFSLFNEPVQIGKPYNKNIILKESLDIASEIRLLHDQNNFSIRFDALEFTTPGNIRYEYILKGLDNHWQSLPQGNRTAVYTNVPPGIYVFIVKASLPGGEIKESRLKVQILPPWWLTWWAKSAYSLLFLFIGYTFYHLIKSRQQEKERMMEQAHNEELSQAKLQFFTDISHEIRTPLTLVISPLLKLIQEDHQREHQLIYQTMQRNANRILRLVNQLLDIRKIDKKQMKLRVREIDVISFVNDTMESFQPLSIDKQIRFMFSSQHIPDTVWLDIDFLDKILYNLFSNAFKFTPAGGEISVFMTVDDRRLRIQVADTGKGISSEHISSIFERFYQVREHKKSSDMGTGIGLHLIRMLVELHHGSIEVSSTPKEGSTFVINLPYTRNFYNGEEISDTPLEYNGSSIDSVPPLLIMEEEGLSKEKREGSKRKPMLLIVEDHTEIRSLLRNELTQHFRILESEDGKKGYELATEHLPDLIITDIMMPVSDGIEMTKRLRGNNNTRSIPIIMLTARTTMEESIEGVEAGADVYIPKPFDLRFLMANIVNLLNKKTLLKARTLTEELVKPEDVHIASADEKLMEKLNQLIKERLSDSELSIELISKELGISRVHLHRKLKEAYQLSPSIYLRNIRLKYAACMLKSKKISIAEVAYAVGFNSHQYFSNCFKDFYGISPMDYAEKNRTNHSEVT